jgi:hypothetical protein
VRRPEPETRRRAAAQLHQQVIRGERDDQVVVAVEADRLERRDEQCDLERQDHAVAAIERCGEQQRQVDAEERDEEEHGRAFPALAPRLHFVHPAPVRLTEQCRERVRDNQREHRDRVEHRLLPRDQEQDVDRDRVVNLALRAPRDAVQALEETETLAERHEHERGGAECQHGPVRGEHPGEAHRHESAGEVDELARDLDRRMELAVPELGRGEDRQEQRADRDDVQRSVTR